MAIGKRTLPLAPVYSGTPDEALAELYTAVNQLGLELAVTAGTAAIIASVAIAKGNAVNIFNGQLRLADASLSRPAIGIALGATAIGQKARIMLGSGYVGGLSGLTANASIYLGNAGALVFVKPGSGFIQGLGIALSATELFVTISQP